MQFEQLNLLAYQKVGFSRNQKRSIAALWGRYQRQVQHLDAAFNRSVAQLLTLPSAADLDASDLQTLLHQQPPSSAPSLGSRTSSQSHFHTINTGHASSPSASGPSVGENSHSANVSPMCWGFNPYVYRSVATSDSNTTTSGQNPNAPHALQNPPTSGQTPPYPHAKTMDGHLNLRAACAMFNNNKRSHHSPGYHASNLNANDCSSNLAYSSIRPFATSHGVGSAARSAGVRGGTNVGFGGHGDVVVGGGAVYPRSAAGGGGCFGNCADFERPQVLPLAWGQKLIGINPDTTSTAASVLADLRSVMCWRNEVRVLTSEVF